jgi:hypothetical protein
MKRKAIRIDWDELESAFDSKHEDDLYYLDLVTGEVVLEGEGEGDDSPDDDDMEEALDTGAEDRNDAFRLYVQPPLPEEETEWMRRFVAGEAEIPPEAAAELHAAVDAGSPFAFREAIRLHAEIRDRWFLFRSERLHDMIEDWLREHDVQAADPPPWR